MITDKAKTKPKDGRCFLCPADIPNPWLLEHLRVVHGEGRPDRWVDGAPVVYDPAVKVEDFLAEAGQ
jgi:hypothetical protein